jgi:hypothetical protein
MSFKPFRESVIDVLQETKDAVAISVLKDLMANTRPFYESIVDVLNEAKDFTVLTALGKLLIATELSANHEAIYRAWYESASRAGIARSKAQLFIMVEASITEQEDDAKQAA